MRRSTVALLAIALAVACSSDKINSPNTGPVTQWVLDAITLPTNAGQVTQFGYDLDGDGAGDNALGNVFATLISASGGAFDMQGAMDGAIASGSVVHLISFQSDDASLVTDGAAAADWYAGLATAGFTTGPHQVDTSALASSFVGGLSAGNYSSNNPVTTRVPASAILRIALMPAAPPIDLPINGVHIQWHFSGTTGIASGEIQGSVRQDDVNNYFIPSFAAILNDQIQADTSSATAHAIESLFDKGGCAGATASDGVINVCELATSSLIQTLLAPDVHIYDGVGNYAPAPTGTANALSIGLGFTAVPTSF